MILHNTLATVIVIVYMTLMLGLFIWFILDCRKTKKDMKPIYDKLNQGHRNIEVMKLLLEDDIIDKVDNIIDTNIRMASDNYLDLTFGFRNINDSYLTEEMQTEMSEYIYQSVQKNMTKDVVALISLVHKINNEEELEELIRFRIKMFMISLLIKTNK